jgi:hypothetical protein
MPRNLTAHATLLLLLVLTVRAIGQTVSIHASGGLSHCAIGYRDYYASDFQKINPVVSLGGTVRQPVLRGRAAATAGLSIDGYGLRHAYRSARDFRLINSRLLMSYATFELGFKTTPSQGLSIGLGLGGSLPVMTTGSYLLSVYLPDEPPDLYLYTHGFGRIQRPFLPMASLCVARSIGHLRG